MITGEHQQSDVISCPVGKIVFRFSGFSVCLELELFSENFYGIPSVSASLMAAPRLMNSSSER